MTWATVNIDPLTEGEFLSWLESTKGASVSFGHKHHDSNLGTMLEVIGIKHEGKYSKLSIANKTFYMNYAKMVTDKKWDQKGQYRTLLLEYNKDKGYVKCTGVRGVCYQLEKDLPVLFRCYKAMLEGKALDGHVSADSGPRFPDFFVHLHSFYLAHVPAWYKDENDRICNIVNDDPCAEVKFEQVSQEAYQSLMDVVTIAADYLKDYPEILEPLMTAIIHRFPKSIVDQSEPEWNDIGPEEVFPDCSKCSAKLLKAISQHDGVTMAEYMCRSCGPDAAHPSHPYKAEGGYSTSSGSSSTSAIPKSKAAAKAKLERAQALINGFKGEEKKEKMAE